MKKNKNLITIALLGAAVYFFTRQQSQPQVVYHNYPTVPPAPPKQTPEWTQWVNTVLQVYGNVSDLWKPGGPFYNQNQSDILNNPDITVGEPTGDYGGWA